MIDVTEAVCAEPLPFPEPVPLNPLSRRMAIINSAWDGVGQWMA